MVIPSSTPRPWYVRRIWPAGFGLLSGLVTGGAALVEELTSAAPSPLQTWSLAAALLSTLLLGVFSVARGRYDDRLTTRRESPEDLRGCLHVLHRLLAGYKGVQTPPEGWLRITIHRVDGHELEQILPYVGAVGLIPDGGAGRRFSISAGLIGKVARAGKPQRFQRPEDMGFDEWQMWLVEHTGMTRAQAAGTRSDRFSFFGLPIPGPDAQVIGVLYLDAAEPDFFGSDTIEFVTWGCIGLAKWIDERYLRR